MSKVKPIYSTSRLRRNAGLNRIEWNLRPSPRRRRGGTRGPISFARVPPGAYLATLTVDGVEMKQTIRVNADPEYSATTNTFDEDELLRKFQKQVDD